MLIWGCLLIPIIVSIVLLTVFKHKIVWWEIIAPFIISAFVIVAVKSAAEYSLTTDTEWFGTYAANAKYYEDWDEKVSCRHSYNCNCSTDSEGNESCSTCYMHFYDVDYHAPYWTIETVSNEKIYIAKTQYENLVNQFGNSSFIELNRNYHSDDGDMYVTKYDGHEFKMEPVFIERTYVNKVQNSTSVFNFSAIDKNLIKVVDYSGIYNNYKQNHILGDAVLPANVKDLAENMLAIINAKLGVSKQAKIIFVLYKNKPLQVAIDQESYWKGGNKNELIVSIGVDNDNKVQWSYVFSWTDVNILKVEVRDRILDQKDKSFDVIQAIDDTHGLVEKKWKRKHFRDFDYLTVEPPLWGYVTAFFVTLLSCLGFGYFAIVNEFEH